MSFYFHCQAVFSHALESWTYPDITQRSCLWKHKYSKQLDWTPNWLFPVSSLVQNLCSFQMSPCVNRTRHCSGAFTDSEWTSTFQSRDWSMCCKQNTEMSTVHLVLNILLGHHLLLPKTNWLFPGVWHRQSPVVFYSCERCETDSLHTVL